MPSKDVCEVKDAVQRTAQARPRPVGSSEDILANGSRNGSMIARSGPDMSLGEKRRPWGRCLGPQRPGAHTSHGPWARAGPSELCAELAPKLAIHAPASTSTAAKGLTSHRCSSPGNRGAAPSQSHRAPSLIHSKVQPSRKTQGTLALLTTAL